MPRKTKIQPPADSVQKPIAIPVKRLSDSAKLPTKAHDTDACFDLYASKTVRVAANGVSPIPTGIAFNIPPGYFGKVYERSGLSVQRPMAVKAGVIDAGYTGEILVVVHNHGDMPEMIDAGMKLAQIAIHELPVVELVEVQDLTSTLRGDKGFGSSGT
jgi:dUTP pyrophosphatase